VGVDTSARVPVVLPDSTDTATGLDETDGEALGAEAVEEVEAAEPGADDERIDAVGVGV
jgi:hypothetical protein